MKVMLSGLACVISFATAGAAAPVDYQRDVQPILAKNCVACHNGQKAKAGIRLDSLDATIKSEVAVAGKSQISSLFNCLSGAAGTPRMPPKGAGLTQAEITIIKNWIDEGAKAPAQGQGQGIVQNKQVPPMLNRPAKVPDNQKRLQELAREQQKKLLERMRERAKEARENRNGKD